MGQNLTIGKLSNLYLDKHKSSSEIARIIQCSENKINYWLNKYRIKKRTISEAVYLKCNPKGDPFTIKSNLNRDEVKLNAVGLGIYWGEGDKSPNNTSIRVSNTDPFLIKKFREFLKKIYKVKKDKIQYSLILFNDIDKKIAVEFWKKELKIKEKQLGKIIVIPSQGKGMYKNKSKYGVLTIIFTNKKLKEKILKDIKKL
jgi:hypothetical protein